MNSLKNGFNPKMNKFNKDKPAVFNTYNCMIELNECNDLEAIAKALNLSAKTLENHRAKLTKIGALNKTRKKGSGSTVFFDFMSSKSYEHLKKVKVKN